MDGWAQRGAHVAAAVDLADAEIDFLTRAMRMWSGPARCTPGLARAMGFDDVDDLVTGAGPGLADAVAERRELSRADWTRVLLAAEFVFASDVFGAGLDWSVVSGRSDVESLHLLRDVQRRLAGVVLRRQAPSSGTE